MNILNLMGLACWSLVLILTLFTRKDVSWWLYALVVSLIILFHVSRIGA